MTASSMGIEDLNLRPDVEPDDKTEAAATEARVSWMPDLDESDAPMYSRLLSALEQDVASGQLPEGFRLPTQRALARVMGISSGTVTRAYAEAERLGIVHGQVGRGTFVKGQPQTPAGGRSVDMSLNVSRPQMDPGLISRTVQRLEQHSHFVGLLGYSRFHAGEIAFRRSLSDFLGSPGYRPDPEQMVITNGAQHGLALALGVTCRENDTLLTESATYHGMKALASFRHLKLAGVEMDVDGLIPDALAAAAQKTGAKTLYMTPTLQNPTARVMSLTRRKEIVKVARKHDLWIIEDDVYAFLVDGVTPIAELAPERTFYVNSLSKCLLPALRIGMLVPPATQLDRTLVAMRASAWMSSPLTGAIADSWIREDIAQTMVKMVRDEAVRRTNLAKSILGSRLVGDPHPSFHIWIESPADEISHAANYAREHGVITTPISAPLVAPDLICGMRLAIGAPDNLDRLGRALAVIRDAFDIHPRHTLSII